ncbi:MAG: site-2 protease family protein [Rhodospirillaceae bacterium]|nr:site-2 protease family protein [Rhodospirillaceae bacterium]
MDSALNILEIIVTVGVPAILAITLHEAAHGYAALAFGDDTAARMGRLSLNPLRHVDPLGTIVLPAMLVLSKAPFILGWAKPVPVNFMALRSPRRDMVWVAAAGPLMNIALAFISAGLIHMAGPEPAGARAWLSDAGANGLVFNVILAVFNMLPIPPLDGGRVAVGLLPLPAAQRLARLEKYGMFILLGALIGLPWAGSAVGVMIDPFGWVVMPVVDAIVSAIAAITSL